MKYRGTRIRFRDKDLVCRSVVTVVVVFLSIYLALNSQGIKKMLIDGMNLFANEMESERTRMIVSLTVLLLLFGGLFFLYWRYGVSHYEKLIHRQKLARMVVDNGWYTISKEADTSFFKDVSFGKEKEKITYFPKMYYRMKKGVICISLEVRMNQFQEQFLKLEKKLESGLFCELIEKEVSHSYIEYALQYDMLGNRISIDEAIAENGSLKLMSNIYWAYDELPHMLIAGGTGGGKTYFILTIIESLLRTNAVMYVADPKNSDLADLAVILPKVTYKKEDIIDMINTFYEGMMYRTETMKQLPNYQSGKNYAYLGLEPHFFIFDEYVAFMEMLDNKESAEVLNKLKKIVMLGRQMGYFLILACQRPDAKYLGDGIRDQFNFRVALGRNSELGYTMMFGETNKDFFNKKIKGRGYVDVGTNVITEFYTPIVPKDHDILATISRIASERGLKPANVSSVDYEEDEI